MSTGGTERGLHPPHIPTPDLRGAARWLDHYKGRLLLAVTALGGIGITTFELLTNHNPSVIDQTSRPGAAEPIKPSEPGQGIILPQSPGNESSQNPPSASPTAEANNPPEKEAEARCDLFKDPKFCSLAEVYQMTNPKVGTFKGVGIKRPSDPSVEIVIVAPFDGYLRHSPSNLGSGSISTDRNVVNGFGMNGNFEFIPVIRADGMEVKKGQKIATIQNLGLTPLSQAPEYIAFFSPQAIDTNGRFISPNFSSTELIMKNEKLIQEHFSTAYAKLPRELPFQPAESSTNHQQNGVIVQ